LLTFDDGYRNFARYGLPVLQRLRIPSVLFVLPGVVDSHGWLAPTAPEETNGRARGLYRLSSLFKPLAAIVGPGQLDRSYMHNEEPAEDDYSLLDWEELAKVVQDGALEVGSHCLSHRPLTKCDPATLHSELTGARRLIQQKLGVGARAVAYPYGMYSLAVLAAAQACGYSIGFTTDPRHARRADNPLAIPRILVGAADHPSRFASRLSGWIEWLRSA
jgi:peptidoglycan/xylan/chitin deacetylase (PgdA/CDA1 family)